MSMQLNALVDSAAKSTGRPELEVHCFIDPTCPWAWITSRWLVEVSPLRGLDLQWRSFSLDIRDGGKLPSDIPEVVRPFAQAARSMSRGVLRIFEALRADRRGKQIDALYTEYGRRHFVATRSPAAPRPTLLREAIDACGLDPRLEDCARDRTWDAAIVASMEEAAAVVGPDAATPTIVIDDGMRRGAIGPTMSSAPVGQAALRVWDGFVLLMEEAAFAEIHRFRGVPELPELA